MPELEFTIRLNSPAFLGAATELREGQPVRYPVDPIGLRVPTLRGVLAFWYRSLWGHLEPEAVFTKQAAVFGSASGGQGVRILPRGQENMKAGELTFETPSGYPFLYLGYGPLQLQQVLNGNRTHLEETKRQVTSFHDRGHRERVDAPLNASPRFTFEARGSHRQLQELKRALRLAHLFGGVGGRSRRGWGSIDVEAEGLDLKAGRDEDIEAYFRRILVEVWEGVEFPVSASLPRFSAFCTGTKIHYHGEERGSWERVLLTFYERFEETRLWKFGQPASSQKPIPAADHRVEESDARLRQLTAAPQRLAFGLPYAPKSRNGWSISYFGSGPDQPDTARRASPVLLKVFRLKGRALYAVALHLKAQFFGHSTTRIRAKVDGRPLPEHQDPPGASAIQEFLAAWPSIPFPPVP